MEFLENITPRKYQQRIFETCSEKNCLVVLPTGLGKTLIALMLSVERIKKFPGEKIIFLAPTKPLAEQHFKYFKKHLPELFAEMELFTGEVKAEQRKRIWQTCEIIFSTPQCVANDLKNNLYDLGDACLLIEDEAHRCLKNYDYNYIAQKYKEQAKHQRIVGLTASPGSDSRKIKDICINLSIEEVELRTRESDDVKEYLQNLEFERISVEFPSEFEEIRQALKVILNQYIEDLRARNLLFEPPTKINILNLQKRLAGAASRGNKNFNSFAGMSSCAQAIKIQHALDLIETQTVEGFVNYLEGLKDDAEKRKSKGVINLVAKSEFRYAFQKAKEILSEGKEHPKIHKLVEIIKERRLDNQSSKTLIFAEFRDTSGIIAKNLNQIEGIIAKTFVGQAKKKDTGLSQKEQKKMIEEFSSGEVNVLCATSIGEEGLDIPEVNEVIFYEPVASAIRKIQRAGRTARLMKGKLTVLVTKKTKDETYYYASRSREKKMYSAIGSIKEELNMKGNLSEEKQQDISKFFK